MGCELQWLLYYYTKSQIFAKSFTCKIIVTLRYIECRPTRLTDLGLYRCRSANHIQSLQYVLHAGLCAGAVWGTARAGVRYRSTADRESPLPDMDLFQQRDSQLPVW